MIRLLRCIKKRDDISDMEFRRFWESAEYNDIFTSYVNASEGISVQMNLVLKIDLNNHIQMMRGTQEPYDGIIELFWPSAKSAAALLSTAKGKQLIIELAQYENQFVDITHSSISITESS
tara:strand:+ start:2968 stop:3327 length:360 start_codon:yes stop_codon:yes gene_type:complete